MQSLRHAVVRMYLNGEVGRRVDDFQQDGKFRAVPLIYMVTHEVAHIDLDKLREGVFAEVAVLHFGLVALNARYVPAFAYGGHAAAVPVYVPDFLSTPYLRFEYGLEFHRV